MRSVGRVVFLIASDLLALAALAAVMNQIREGMLGSFGRFVTIGLPEGYLGGWHFAVALLVGLTVSGAYRRGDNWKKVGRAASGTALAVALALWYGLWRAVPETVALQFAVSFLGVLGLISIGRRVTNLVVQRMLNGRHTERTIFVGDPDDPGVAEIKDTLLKGHVVCCGWVHSSTSAIKSPSLGRPNNIWEILQSVDADTVILCGELENDVFELVVDAATVAGCRILSVPRYMGVPKVKLGMVWHEKLPFVELTVPALKAQQLLVKRAIDVLVSSVLLIALAPVLLLIAVLVRVGSPGPVFFSHERVGYGGRIFRMTKFRTMYEGADSEKDRVAHMNHTGDPRLFKIPNDPRVTNVGAWLRRWSLDELPQLWNVLVGHMSLVGPRPFFEADLAEYADHHFSRLGAKPGITGLWQVRGRSVIVDFEEVIRLDCEYIDRWSLWLDVKILLGTLPAVLRKTGAF